MNISHSYLQTFINCRQLAFKKYHQGLGSLKTMALVDGTSYHDILAHGLATKDWDAALLAGRIHFDEEIKQSVLLPEESWKIEDNWELIVEMQKLYRLNFEQENITIVQPECDFNVSLTGSEHNCIFEHWINRKTGRPIWNTPPTPQQILDGDVESPHALHKNTTCPCYKPHTLSGRIDGVFLWNGMLWIMDHKTTALNRVQFWNQWGLHLQPMLYMWAAKQVGIEPKGFIINAVFKPSEAQVSAWNSKRKSGTLQVKDYLKYEREPFLKTEEDLTRAVSDTISYCNEWEWRVLQGGVSAFPRNPSNCHNYNRVCEMHSACVEHDSPEVMAGFVKLEHQDVEGGNYRWIFNGVKETVDNG